jgi:tetratricopeptide (TPR) repeat protein
MQPEIKLKIDEVKKLMEENKKAEAEKTKEQEQKKLDELTKQAQVFVAQGDLSKEMKDYPTAITNYNSAISLYNDNAMTKEATEIAKKIVEVNALIQDQATKEKTNAALLFDQNGDAKMEENKLEEAKQNYNSAKKIYMELSLSEEIIKINNKLSLVNQAYKNQETDKKAQEIALLEGEADKFFLLGRYTQAQSKYRQAQALYQGIGATDKVLLLEGKIKQIDELVTTSK